MQARAHRQYAAEAERGIVLRSIFKPSAHLTVSSVGICSSNVFVTPPVQEKLTLTNAGWACLRFFGMLNADGIFLSVLRGVLLTEDPM